MTLNTAVVGLGVVSETHLDGIEQNPRTRLAAVCDLDAARVRDVTDRYNVPGYNDIDTLIDSAQLDWVHICTPVQTHIDLAEPFIESGVPVLIEKPITATTADLERLQSLSADNDVPVTEVQNHVFDPAMRKLTDAVESGDIGQVRGVDTIYVGETLPDKTNRGDWVFDLPGGEFEEGLPHPIYLTLEAGGWPESDDAIHASTALARSYDADIEYDGAQVQYTTEDGVLCSIKMLAGSQPQRRLYVHGTDGSLMVDFVSQTLVPVERDYTASSVSRARYNIDQSIARVRGTTENSVAVARRQLGGDWESMKSCQSHYYQFDETSHAIERGTEMPIPLEQSHWTISILEQLRSVC